MIGNDGVSKLAFLVRPSELIQLLKSSKLTVKEKRKGR